MARALAPIPGRRHIEGDGGERGGFGAQDAGAKADAGGAGGEDAVALLGREAAFGTDQDGGGAGRGGRGERSAAGLVGEQDAAPGRRAGRRA
jgi:hypothetical protein